MAGSANAGKERKRKQLKEKAKHLKHKIEDLDVQDRRKLKAVAVQYETKKGKAPKIIATGRGAVAERILKIAEEHEVPFFEDKTLTDLLAKLELDVEIPSELYTLVAEVLAVVYQLDKMAKKRRKARRKFGSK